MQRNRKICYILRKKTRFPDKDLMINLLDKDFKTTMFRMLKELKENLEKVAKYMNMLEISVKRWKF